MKFQDLIRSLCQIFRCVLPGDKKLVSKKSELSVESLCMSSLNRRTYDSGYSTMAIEDMPVDTAAAQSDQHKFYGSQLGETTRYGPEGFRADRHLTPLCKITTIVHSVEVYTTTDLDNLSLPSVSSSHESESFIYDNLQENGVPKQTSTNPRHVKFNMNLTNEESEMQNDVHSSSQPLLSLEKADSGFDTLDSLGSLNPDWEHWKWPENAPKTPDDISAILIGLPWVVSSECSIKNNNKWEVIVKKEIGIRRAFHLLNKHLNPERKLEYEVYEYVKGEFRKSANENGKESEEAKAAGQASECIKIGSKIERKDEGDKQVFTTLGASFILTDEKGLTFNCVFTNCEATPLETPCSLVGGQYIGKCMAALEGHVEARTAVNTSIKTYVDGMFVQLENNASPPSNYVMVARGKNNILLPRVSQNSLVDDTCVLNERVIKVLPKISGQPDGIIISEKFTFRCPDTGLQYANVMKVISASSPDMTSISECGDCGTLLASVPGHGDTNLEVYASVFGEWSVTKRNSSGDEVTESSTVAYHLKYFLDAFNANSGFTAKF